MILAAMRRVNPAPYLVPTSVSLEIVMLLIGHQYCQLLSMFQPSVSISDTSANYSAESTGSIAKRQLRFLRVPKTHLWLDGIRRRWRRERRRRKVGRAYDMALEIARVLPAKSRVLDVGCGNGLIAHHLSAMLNAKAIGIDLDARAEAAIDYRQFDGKQFPVADRSVDAVLFCYVLHHAQDLSILMKELRRVLSFGGRAVIYEDIPSAWWDRFVCWTHNLKWRKRTGPCTFRNESEWRTLFNSAGFDILTERPLSRCRNLTHPVTRRFYVLKQNSAQAVTQLEVVPRDPKWQRSFLEFVSSQIEFDRQD
jgi:SAM-dependent methyltransferase